RPQPDLKAKVIFVGNSGVGKTSILLRNDGRDFEASFTSTIGANFIHSTVISRTSKKVELEIWDTAGSEKYANLMPMYLRRSSGAFLVFDVADRDSFNDLSKWCEELEHANLPGFSVVLVGNKIDLKREVQEEEARGFAREKSMRYVETSALEDKGIGEMMQTMVEMLVHRFECRHLTSQHKDTVDIHPAKRNTESSCNCAN
ncbi:hypothetical protein PMAYCL1PPCAC_07694, partial [Pristionchus mayeri]